MRIKLQIAFVLLFGLALLGACSPKKSEPPKPQTDKPFPWNATLATSPEQPQSNKPVEFRLTLADKSGNPVPGAQVRGSLVMPLMDMGKNEFTFSDKGTGAYTGTGKMDMTGPWELVVTAKADGVEGQKTFPLSARE